MRDETLELELEMYRRQCKDLLQERLIMSKIAAGHRGGSLSNMIANRNLQPSYELTEDAETL